MGQTKPTPPGDTHRIAVIGAGSWGTALAIQFARAGSVTRLWSRNPKHAAEIAQQRCNSAYLPGALFPTSLQIETDLQKAISDVDDILIVVPSHAFRSTLTQIKETGVKLHQLCWATKGFELDTGLLPNQIAQDIFGSILATAVLSGPTFAAEVAVGLPSALTIASSDDQYANALAKTISTSSFRAYTSRDVIGVEVGGATKNVYAIGAGLSDGLGFGANTRIALVTRGLAEMTRLGTSLGAQRETFMGLAGMGDLVLTCTDDLSRNRRFGKALAEGIDPVTAQRQIAQVVEGYFGARAVHKVAQKHHVDMPIVDQIYRVLYEELEPKTAVANLMARPMVSEHD